MTSPSDGGIDCLSATSIRSTPIPWGARECSNGLWSVRRSIVANTSMRTSVKARLLIVPGRKREEAPGVPGAVLPSSALSSARMVPWCPGGLRGRRQADLDRRSVRQAKKARSCKSCERLI